MESDVRETEVQPTYYLPSILDDTSDDERRKPRPTRSSSNLWTLRRGHSWNLDSLRRSDAQAHQTQEIQPLATLRRSASASHEFSPTLLKRSASGSQEFSSSSLRRSASGSQDFAYASGATGSLEFQPSEGASPKQRKGGLFAVRRFSPANMFTGVGTALASRDHLLPRMIRRAVPGGSSGNSSSSNAVPTSPTGNFQTSESYPAPGSSAFAKPVLRKSRSGVNQTAPSLPQVRRSNSGSSCLEFPASHSAVAIGMDLEHVDSPVSPPASYFIPMPSFIRNAGNHEITDRLSDAPVREALALQIYDELHGTIPLQRLEDLEAEGTLAQIPRNELGELTSVGSIFHEDGPCSPCAYWFKGICKYGLLCSYCHFVHDGQKCKRLRPSKQARMRLRKREIQGLDAQVSDDTEDLGLGVGTSNSVDQSLEDSVRAFGEPRDVHLSPLATRVSSPCPTQASAVFQPPVFVEGFNPSYGWSL